MAASSKQYTRFQSPTEPGTIDPQLLAADIVASADEIAEWSPQRLEGCALSRFTEEQLKIPMDERSLPNVIYDALWRLIKELYKRRNAMAARSDYWGYPKRLAPDQIARVILLSIRIARVITAEEDITENGSVLAVYQESGEDAGLWVTNDYLLVRCVRAVCGSDLRASDYKLVERMLKSDAPVIHKTTDRDLIAMNNGIFDYRSKTLLPFSPDYVFLNKCRTNYNPDAQDVDIVMPNGEHFTVDGWFASVSDDPEIVQLLWELVSAALRPNVSWDKAAFLYSESGNSGKGTFCSLVRNLLGASACASIPIRLFDKDFMLSSLVTAQAIITDENAIGTYLESADNFKAIVTGDPILINRKHRDPVSVHFVGFMIQCFNEMPRIRDTTDSVYRRQLFVPMDKCFTGTAIKEIKADYLKRPEVLEYVARRALESNFYELSNPAASQEALDEYKDYNDNVRDFFYSVICECGTLDAYPWAMLYPMYVRWMQENNPQAKPKGSYAFRRDIMGIISRDGNWYCPNVRWQFRAGDLMKNYEPLIAKYDLKRFYKPGVKDHSSKDAVTDVVDHNARFRGIRRMVCTGSGIPTGRPTADLASGTDALAVTVSTVDDVMLVGPYDEPRMRSGAPVPPEIMAELEADEATTDTQADTSTGPSLSLVPPSAAPAPQASSDPSVPVQSALVQTAPATPSAPVASPAAADTAASTSGTDDPDSSSKQDGSAMRGTSLKGGDAR